VESIFKRLRIELVSYQRSHGKILYLLSWGNLVLQSLFKSVKTALKVNDLNALGSAMKRFTVMVGIGDLNI